MGYNILFTVINDLGLALPHHSIKIGEEEKARCAVFTQRSHSANKHSHASKLGHNNHAL